MSDKASLVSRLRPPNKLLQWFECQPGELEVVGFKSHSRQFIGYWLTAFPMHCPEFLYTQTQW